MRGCVVHGEVIVRAIFLGTRGQHTIITSAACGSGRGVQHHLAHLASWVRPRKASTQRAVGRGIQHRRGITSSGPEVESPAAYERHISHGQRGRALLRNRLPAGRRALLPYAPSQHPARDCGGDGFYMTPYGITALDSNLGRECWTSWLHIAVGFLASFQGNTVRRAGAQGFSSTMRTRASSVTTRSCTREVTDRGQRQRGERIGSSVTGALQGTRTGGHSRKRHTCLPRSANTELPEPRCRLPRPVRSLLA